MPNSIRLKLLLEPDNKTVQELSTFDSKGQALKNILPDEDATTTAFNNVSPASSQMSDALNSIVNTNKELIRTQKEMGNQMQHMSSAFGRNKTIRGNRSFNNNWGQTRGHQRSSFNPPNTNNNNFVRGNNNYGGQSTSNGYTRGRYNQNQGRSRCNFRNVFCNHCGQPGQKRVGCWYKPQPERGTNKPFDEYIPPKN